MSKYKIWGTVLFNLVISFLYFKQIFFTGNEIQFLKTKEILLTPFLLFYTLLGIMLCLFIDRKVVKNHNITSLIFLIIIVGLLIFPITFFQYKKDSEVALTFISAFIEPIKILFLFKQSIKVLLQKTFILMIGSFCLIFFISIFFSNIDQTNYIYYYGGIYFLIVSLLDYYFHKILVEKQLVK